MVTLEKDTVDYYVINVYRAEDNRTEDDVIRSERIPFNGSEASASFSSLTPGERYAVVAFTMIDDVTGEPSEIINVVGWLQI